MLNVFSLLDWTDAPTSVTGRLLSLATLAASLLVLTVLALAAFILSIPCSDKAISMEDINMRSINLTQAIAPAINAGGSGTVGTPLAIDFMRPENGILYRVGHLLKTQDGPHTMAGWLIQGETYPLGGKVLCLDGRPVEVSEFTLSLTDIGQWACPFCASAHGTNRGASARKGSVASALGLEVNKWYVNPRTHRLFTISNTCFEKYVRVQMAGRIFDGPSQITPAVLAFVASKVGEWTPPAVLASQPVASEPAASQPAVLASQPVASEPAASQPVASEPAASQPAASGKRTR